MVRHSPQNDSHEGKRYVESHSNGGRCNKIKGISRNKAKYSSNKQVDLLRKHHILNNLKLLLRISGARNNEIKVFGKDAVIHGLDLLERF